MVSREWAKRVVSALHALGKRHHGGLSYAERHAKVSQSYIRRRKNAGTMDLARLMTILGALGEHPARFFRQVFPAHGHSYRRILDAPNSEPPGVVKEAYRRLESDRPGSIPRSHIEELDRLRYDEPARTASSVASALDFVAQDDLSLSLGVWASAQRLCANFDDAAHALLAGLAIAEERDDLRGTGSLLQRFAYLVAENGDYSTALTLATEATDVLAQAGEFSRLAQSMVDRGIWLYYLERHTEAIAMHERAQVLLAPDDVRFRVASLQNIGFCHIALGNPTEARRHVGMAIQQFTDELGRSCRYKLVWIDGLIDASVHAYEAGESKLQQVVTVFRNIHYGEAALASVDLAEIQLQAGKPEAAYASAHAILPLVTPLGVRHKIVRSAEQVLVGLSRLGAQGMSEQAVTELRATLSPLKRERHAWRSLGAVP